MASLVPIKVFRGSPTQVLDEATQLSGVSASYTVPTGKRLILKYIRITNQSATNAISVNMKTGPSTLNAANYVLRNVAVPAFDVQIFEMNEVLDAGDKIFLWQDATSDVSLQISGIEVTL